MKKKIRFCSMHSAFVSIIIILFGTGLVGTASICLAQGDIWTTKASMNIGRDNFSTCAVNGKIYAMGGDDEGLGNNATGSQGVEEYDPVTDTWTIKANMPTGRLNLSISAVNGKIYAIGGTDSGTTSVSTVEEYDPLTDSWTERAPMPTARAALSSSVVNGKIYVIGGIRFFFTTLKGIVKYDPLTNTWTEKASMPTARAFLATAVVDGIIYACGGDPANSTLNIVEAYDPATNTWTTKAPMLGQRQNVSASAANGKIYVIGGSSSPGGSGTSAVQEYDPLTDSWTFRSPMPTPRVALHTSALNGKIYAIGGSTTSWPFQPVPTVEEYMPPVVTSVEDHSRSEYSPEEFALHQNYPNPFNPETTIQYQVLQSSEVKLVILNLLGQRIATLVDEVQSMGVYSVQWDGKDDTGKEVASGVYLYRVQTEQFVQVKKLALLR